MRTLLICHDGDEINRHGLARWLASFSELTGIVVLEEDRRRVLERIKHEIKRVGFLRFLDVLAFRVYYKYVVAAHDAKWKQDTLTELFLTYPEVPPSVPILHASSPNSSESESFIEQNRPDVMIARCKNLLAERVFSIPTTGTFVMHPGVCPEYRNAHGCFWALARDDLENVGMTLLKIDEGIDTGPVYGFFSYAFDERAESHIVIQYNVVLKNLTELEEKLSEVHAGRAVPLSTAGRESRAWGQPWLTTYLRWKRRAKSRSA